MLSMLSGAGGGRDRGRACRVRRRLSRSHHLRHGRHVDRRVPRARRHLRHDHGRPRRRLSDQDPADRHQLDRRRRRQHRRTSAPGAISRSARDRPAPCRGLPATAAAALEPTITDANVVLGRLGVDRPLGGEIVLDRGAALAAVAGLATRARRRSRRDGGGHPAHRRRFPGRRDQGGVGDARHRSARLRAACRSVALGRCMPQPSRTSSACAPWSCRRCPATSRRWGC